jgi:hypothetical protein
MIVILGKGASGRTTYIKNNYINNRTIVFDPCATNEYENISTSVLIHKFMSDDFIDRFMIEHKFLRAHNKHKKISDNDLKFTIIMDDLPIDDKLIEHIKILLKFDANIVITTTDANIFNYVSITQSKIIYSAPYFKVYQVYEFVPGI